MPDARKKKRDKAEDLRHNEGQIQLDVEQREANNEEFKGRALEFAKVVFARILGFDTGHTRTIGLTYHELDEYVHQWRNPQELPGYDEDHDDNLNEYWIFDVPYIHEPFDIKKQVRGVPVNGYRLIVEMFPDRENHCYRVTGRYWYTFGHYGDGVRGFADVQFTTGNILGLSVSNEQFECERHDMFDIMGGDITVDGQVGQYNDDSCHDY